MLAYEYQPKNLLDFDFKPKKKKRHRTKSSNPRPLNTPRMGNFGQFNGKFSVKSQSGPKGLDELYSKQATKNSRSRKTKTRSLEPKSRQNRTKSSQLGKKGKFSKQNLNYNYPQYNIDLKSNPVTNMLNPDNQFYTYNNNNIVNIFLSEGQKGPKTTKDELYEKIQTLNLLNSEQQDRRGGDLLSHTPSVFQLKNYKK
jgi:hypothetical protein